ncbi:MAG: enoyl-CoA hydratase-related protein [Betaproteobacteria bacterium]
MTAPAEMPAAPGEGISPLLAGLVDGTLTLVLNRPEARNALDARMGELLLEALEAAQHDPAVRVVLLTGAPGAFCAGGDVKAMANAAHEAVQPAQRNRALRRRSEAARLLHEMPKPTVAMIGGAAAGAGLALALACDLRLMARSARLSTAFARVGLSGDYGITYFLPRIVGEARARELLFLSTSLSADEALAAGLVHQVHDGDALEAASSRLIAQLAQGPTLAYAHIKRALLASGQASLGSQLDLETALQVLSQSTLDHHEAARAFVEKRPARFLGA